MPRRDIRGKSSRDAGKPSGEVRFTTGNKTLPTRYTFTGQCSYVSDGATDLGNAGLGLMFYNARWYDPYLNRFTQPDSILPSAFEAFLGVNSPGWTGSDLEWLFTTPDW